jgi:hypothetical protein
MPIRALVFVSFSVSFTFHLPGTSARYFPSIVEYLPTAPALLDIKFVSRTTYVRMLPTLPYFPVYSSDVDRLSVATLMHIPQRACVIHYFDATQTSGRTIHFGIQARFRQWVVLLFLK